MVVLLPLVNADPWGSDNVADSGWKIASILP